MKIIHTRNIRELKSFIGKINFLRRFIPNLTELLRNITKMLKKDFEIKWSIEDKYSFDIVKHALTKAAILTIPNFTKD